MTAIVTDAHYRMSVSLIRDLSERGVRVVACEKASMENPVGFASGASATITASRVSFGHPNALGFELFTSAGAVKYDLERPALFEYWDGTPDARTNGYRTVLAGPAQPYLSGGLPMNFPGVGHGQNDLFVWQARAFLEQVAGAGGGLPPVPALGEGLRNLRLLEAVTESARTGSAVKI